MTHTRTLIITSQDHQRLTDLIRESRALHTEEQAHLRSLQGELDQAQIVAPEDVPADVVTMNSKVRVSAEGSKKSLTWTIVYPENADIDKNRMSVLAPIGTALLGYREGDEIEWDVPAGRRRYRIEKVIRQPEASGRFDL